MKKFEYIKIEYIDNQDEIIKILKQLPKKDREVIASCITQLKVDNDKYEDEIKTLTEDKETLLKCFIQTSHTSQYNEGIKLNTKYTYTADELFGKLTEGK